jgi:hydrogenase maturation protein HypF
MSAMLGRRFNVVWSSGVGRFFDAVAALIIPLIEATFEGEAAMRLEALADPAVEESYDLPLMHFDALPAGDATIPRGDWRPMIAAIMMDLERNTPPSVIAARFHNTLVNWAVRCTERQPEIPVVLSGGCFQNRQLTDGVASKLRSMGRECFTPGLIPAGDSGLAAGQLAVAMARFDAGEDLRKGAA